MLDQSSLQTLVVGKLASMLPPLKALGLRLFRRDAVAKPAYGTSDGKAIVDWKELLPHSEPRALDIAPEEIALLQYTGGTTGRPKGAMLSHANLAANAQQVNAIDPFDRKDPDVIMGALPLFHVFAMTVVMNFSVHAGAKMILLPRFELDAVLKVIHKKRPTFFPAVPTIYIAINNHPGVAAGKFDLTSMQYCLAIAMTRGAVMLGDFRPGGETPADAAHFMAKVEMRVHDGPVTQADPAAKRTSPTAISFAAVSADASRSASTHCPATMPRSVVTMAGSVLRTPSGSHSLSAPAQRCCPSSSRSTYAGRVSAATPRCPAPMPGTGTSSSAAQ